MTTPAHPPKATTTEPATHQVALLVEGDAEIEQVLRKILEPRGWEIVLAAGTADALEQVKLRQFGLIVTAGHTSGAEDVELLHDIWLKLSESEQLGARLHHRDIVGVALRRLRKDLEHIDRDQVVAEVQRELRHD